MHGLPVYTTCCPRCVCLPAAGVLCLLAAGFVEAVGHPIRAMPQIDKNVEREIINHRQLSGHPNIVRFRDVFLTSTHLGIAMEYAAGGELFDRIVKAGRFAEDEARYFFQQLISGVAWCHREGVCHRDLKLENTLLDGRPAPRLKICDFGYSKVAGRLQQPHSHACLGSWRPRARVGAARCRGPGSRGQPSSVGRAGGVPAGSTSAVLVLLMLLPPAS